MARKPRQDPRPGHTDYLPLTDAERRAHADALARAHDGHHCDEHAGALCQAAEYYAMLGEHDLAEKYFKQALDDGGPVPGSIHGLYASFLLDQGRDTEAFNMITKARREDPDDPDVFNITAKPCSHTITRNKQPAGSPPAWSTNSDTSPTCTSTTYATTSTSPEAATKHAKPST